MMSVRRGRVWLVGCSRRCLHEDSYAAHKHGHREQTADQVSTASGTVMGPEASGGETTYEKMTTFFKDAVSMSFPSCNLSLKLGSLSPTLSAPSGDALAGLAAAAVAGVGLAFFSAAPASPADFLLAAGAAAGAAGAGLPALRALLRGASLILISERRRRWWW